MILRLLHRFRSPGLALLLGASLLCGATAEGQTKKPKRPSPVDELAQIHEEFIEATREYKTSLTKLLAIHERNVTRAEEKLTQSQKLYDEGLISKTSWSKLKPRSRLRRTKLTKPSGA